jgi:hypothetical protein
MSHPEKSSFEQNDKVYIYQCYVSPTWTGNSKPMQYRSISDADLLIKNKLGIAALGALLSSGAGKPAKPQHSDYATKLSKEVTQGIENGRVHAQSPQPNDLLTSSLSYVPPDAIKCRYDLDNEQNQKKP